jgi:hypothetical protein
LTAFILFHDNARQLETTELEMNFSESNNRFLNATRDCDARLGFWFRFFSFSTPQGAGGTMV